MKLDKPTDNDTWKPFFERVYDLLIEHAGAPKSGDTRLSFVLYFTDAASRGTEFRFCGKLGMGGKFWRNAGRFYVTCYKEDETPERLAIIAATNKAIEDALVETLATLEPRVGR